MSPPPPSLKSYDDYHAMLSPNPFLSHRICQSFTGKCLFLPSLSSPHSPKTHTSAGESIRKNVNGHIVLEEIEGVIKGQLSLAISPHLPNVKGSNQTPDFGFIGIRAVNVIGYYTLVLSTFTWLSTLLGFTDRLVCKEDLTSPNGINDEYIRIPKEVESFLGDGKEMKIVRMFEYRFRMLALEVCMLHVTEKRKPTNDKEEKGGLSELHLLEIYKCDWYTLVGRLILVGVASSMVVRFGAGSL